ncbi:asialoglycoprotein receptor 1-like [Discoglossus pictus]
MSKDYQDLQSLHVDGSNTVMRMSRWTPSPSTRILYGLFFICAGLLIILLVVIVVDRKPEVKEKDWNIEYKIGNLSGSVNSQVQQLSRNGNMLMEKLKEAEKSTQKIMMDISKDNLQSDIQAIRNAVWKLSEMVKKLQPNGTQELDCPEDWTPFSLSCYYFSKLGKSWEDSKKLCEDQKSHLVVINSNEEQVYVEQIASRQFAWIGLTDVDGQWKWLDGTNYDSTPKNWIVGQPDEYYGHGLGGGEDCAHLHYSGEWNDDHCSRRYRYICEKNAI